MNFSLIVFSFLILCRLLLVRCRQTQKNHYTYTVYMNTKLAAVYYNVEKTQSIQGSGQCTLLDPKGPNIKKYFDSTFKICLVIFNSLNRILLSRSL